MKSIVNKTKKLTLKVLAAFIVGILVLSTFSPIFVMAESQALSLGNNSGSGQYGPQSKEELEEFLDAYVKKEMEKEHVPGLMISFVKDGELLLNKGYGFTDIEKGKLVDPQSSLMYIGSVGKTFTAAAIMKLVDEGKLNLKEDVNTYLKGFKLKNDTGKTITVEHLLLHTAGFEENVHTLATKDVENRLSTKAAMQKFQPAVVYEPGSIQSYSNYGYSLLGYIIESVTGMPFEEYLQNEIFQPLEMNYTEFNQNPSPEIRKKLSKGYSYKRSTNSHETLLSPEVDRHEYWYDVPAGVAFSNTEELSHFMLFLLNGGRYSNQQVISKETIAHMQNENFISHTDLRGEGYGLSNWELNGHRTLQKSGGAIGGKAHIVLFPEYNQGFAFAFNTENSAFSNGLIKAIADKFYPSIIAKKPRIILSQKELKKFEGFYRYTRYNHTTFEKLMTAIDPQYNEKVVANADGTISIGLMFVSQMVKYEPISATSFQKVRSGEVLNVPGLNIDLGERIAFHKDQNGNVKYMLIPYENLTCEKISSFGYGMVQIGNMVVFTLTAILFILYWLIGGAAQRLLKKGVKISSMQKIADWSGFLSAFSILLFMLILFTNFNGSVVYGLPIMIKVGLIIPILNIVLFSATVIFAVKAWQKKFWKLPSRILYTLFAVANLMFVIWAGYYNLIGWHF